MCALRRGMFNDHLIGKMKKGRRPSSCHLPCSAHTHPHAWSTSCCVPAPCTICSRYNQVGLNRHSRMSRQESINFLLFVPCICFAVVGVGSQAVLWVSVCSGLGQADSVSWYLRWLAQERTLSTTRAARSATRTLSCVHWGLASSAVCTPGWALPPGGCLD